MSPSERMKPFTGPLLPHRVNRDLSRYGKDRSERAREELIAELGSCFLCADLGIVARTRTAPGSRELPRVLARGLVKREALYLLGCRACATRRRLPARPATEGVRGRGGGMMSRQRVDPCRLATALPTRSTIRLRGAQPRRGRPVHNPRSYGRARHHRSDARLCGLRRHRLEADRRLRSPCLADMITIFATFARI